LPLPLIAIALAALFIAQENPQTLLHQAQSDLSAGNYSSVTKGGMRAAALIDTVLDATITVRGDSTAVDAAYARWNNQKVALAGIAASIQRLSGAYDNWFVMIKPIARSLGPPPAISKHHLVDLIEEVRGGNSGGRGRTCRDRPMVARFSGIEKRA
jgi:hypothetical protein